MARAVLALAILLTLGLVWVRGQSAATAEPKGPYLGVLVGPIPEVLYNHLPILPRGRGIVITHIVPDSPASRADLRKHDLVLSYQEKPIEDCEQFAKLIRADKPNQIIKLGLLRGGKETSIEVTLGLGPLLTVAKKADEQPKGEVKPGGPGKVSVAVTPLENGKLMVSIDYYQDGKLRNLTHSGTPVEIDKEMQKLPPRAQDLARAALKRIQALDLVK